MKSRWKSTVANIKEMHGALDSEKRNDGPSDPLLLRVCMSEADQRGDWVSERPYRIGCSSRKSTGTNPGQLLEDTDSGLHSYHIMYLLDTFPVLPHLVLCFCNWFQTLVLLSPFGACTGKINEPIPQRARKGACVPGCTVLPAEYSVPTALLGAPLRHRHSPHPPSSYFLPSSTPSPLFLLSTRCIFSFHPTGFVCLSGSQDMERTVSLSARMKGGGGVGREGDSRSAPGRPYPPGIHPGGNTLWISLIVSLLNCPLRHCCYWVFSLLTFLDIQSQTIK